MPDKRTWSDKLTEGEIDEHKVHLPAFIRSLIIKIHY